MEVEIMCGEDWERSSDISTVPVEHWEWFLGARVGSKSMAQVRWNARKLLTNLRILRDNKGWTHLGLDTWEDALKWFDLTPQKWAWLEAGEPVLTDADSVTQGIEKGRYKQAANLVRTEGITQAEAGERFGITQQAVSKAMNTTEMEDSSKLVVIPAHITERHAIADFRKLTPAGQDRVRQGESLNRVALAEGVRRRPSFLEQAQKAFRRLTKEDRDAFDSWRGGQEL